MSIPRLLVTLVLVLLAALLVLLCYINYANLDRHRAQLETMLEDATGRQITIGGNLDVDLWPSIRLEVNDLTMANADWGSEPTMATIAHASAAVSPLSLVSGPIEIEDFQLRDVTVLLESNEDGVSNLPLAESASAEETSTTAEEPEELQGLPALVDIAVLNNVALTLRAPGVDDQVVRLAQLTLDSRDSDQLALAIEGDILTLPLQLTGKIGTLPQLAERGAGDFQAAGTLGTLNIDLSGHMDSLNTLSGSHLSASLEGKEIENLLQALQLELPFNGPLSLNAEARAEGDTLKTRLSGSVNQLTTEATIDLTGQQAQIDATLGPLSQAGTLFAVEGLPDLPVALTGAVAFSDNATLLQDITVALASAKLLVNGSMGSDDTASSLELTASGDNLRELMATLPEVDFDVSTRVELAGSKVTLKPLKAILGNSDVAGELQLDTADGTDLLAVLTSRKLDLDQLSASPEPDTTQPATDAPATAPAAEAPADSGKYVFTEDPLPWEALQSNDLDIKWNVAEVISTALPLTDLAIVSTLKEGDLLATIDFDTINGGESASKIEMTSGDTHADLKMSLHARKLRLNFLGGDVGVENIPLTDISLDLTSNGGSPRDLAANSNGTFLLTQGPGRVDNKVMGAATTDVFAQLVSALNPFAKNDPYSVFQCGIVSINIVDGLSTLDPIILQQEKVMIIAGGKIDLNDESLKLEFNTKPRSGVGVSADMFVTPFVSLGGTLSSPGIGMNETGTLMAAGAAGAAVATGGLSLLVQGAMNRMQGETDHCKKTLPEHKHPAMVKAQPAAETPG